MQEPCDRLLNCCEGKVRRSVSDLNWASALVTDAETEPERPARGGRPSTGPPSSPFSPTTVQHLRDLVKDMMFASCSLEELLEN
jgi:hypothetical protein